MASPYSQSETAYVFPVAVKEEGDEVSAAEGGPPGHQPHLGHCMVLPTHAPSQAPLCSLTLHHQSNLHPTNRFTPVLPPGQDWGQKELLEATVSSLKPKSSLLPSHQSCLSCSCLSPRKAGRSSSTTCPHLFDLTFQPDDASTLRFGGPNSPHLTDGDSSGDR